MRIAQYDLGRGSNVLFFQVRTRNSGAYRTLRVENSKAFLHAMPISTCAGPTIFKQQVSHSTACIEYFDKVRPDWPTAGWFPTMCSNARRAAHVDEKKTFE